MNPNKVSTRLSLLVGALIGMLVVLGGLGLYGIGQSNASLKTVYENRTVPIAQLAEVQYLMLSNQFALSIAASNPSPDVIELQTALIDANVAKITKSWTAYMRTVLTPEEAQAAKIVGEHRTRLVSEALQPAIEALRGSNVTEARRLAREVAPALYEPTRASMAHLLTLQVEVASQENTEAVARYGRIRAAILLAIALGIAFAALYGTWMTRSLVRSLGAEPQTVKLAAEAVAAGDLSQTIALRSGDADSVMATMKKMRDTLASAVAAVRQNATSVANASMEIAQGNSNLSQRTEQQAGALAQTTSSMERLGSTVRQNADSARQANQLALGASSIAQQGGEVVGQVVDTMRNISDSSKKIADIIGTIDGIAFQTNILALNAAVEAARAGEQGRGFAVVASEVRSLAQRSAEAAKDIKALISASVERVDQGSALVDRAGATMTEVVTAIRRVTDIMGEISAASSEQAASVTQVGQAISQMDRATEQNARLVEQSAAAADNLRVQAAQLVQAVAVFRLEQTPDHPGEHPAALAASAARAAPFPVSRSPAPGSEDRRGPNRAKNVSRLPAKAAPVLSTASLASMPQTGSGEWESF